MGREIEPSLNETEFLLDALQQGVRVDGRLPMEHRPLRIHLSPTSTGCVEVELGNTRILAKVTCEAVRPQPDRPTEGFLRFFSEFSPMGSMAFEAGRTSDEEVVLNRMLEKTLKGSRALDTEGLCIVAGKMVWSIRVDVHVLNQDGNLVDCASIAAITALLHFRRPDITVLGEDVTIHTVENRNPVPLSIHHIPICCTFAFFEQGDLLVVDPTLLEEQVQTGALTIAMNNYRELCGLSKPGGVPLDMSRILHCCQLAFEKTTEITEQIQLLLKEDHARRQPLEGGLMQRKSNSKKANLPQHQQQQQQQ